MNLFGSYAMRWILGVLTFLAAISVLRFKPWMPHSGSTGSLTPREKLVVGFLPVTCHLTCPVTDFATKTSAGTRFESQLFLDFPSMAVALQLNPGF
jgi:NitT/TauT family transport system substrate-binding protein